MIWRVVHPEKVWSMTDDGEPGRTNSTARFNNVKVVVQQMTLFI